MRFLIACVALSLFGCAVSAETSEESVGTTASAIIGGTASTSAEDSVVAIAIRSKGVLSGLCTGTLVAPNLVLTARHCVAVTDDNALCTADGTPLAGGKVRADRSATDLDVYLGAGAVATIRKDPTKEQAAAHGKALVVEGSTFCNADLAFLVLDRAIAGSIAPIRIAPTPAGETFTAVGYGLDQTGTVPASRMSRSGIAVLASGRAAYPGGSGLGDAEMLVGESTCSGDSGGPLLAGTGAVVGVTSRGGGGTGPLGNDAAGCIGAGAHSIYTHLATKQSFVARAYAAASQPIWSEGEPFPYEGDAKPAPSGPANLAAPSSDESEIVAAHDAPKADDEPAKGVDPSSTSESAAEVRTNGAHASSCSMTSGIAGASGGFGWVGVVVTLVLARLRRRA